MYIYIYVYIHVLLCVGCNYLSHLSFQAEAIFFSYQPNLIFKQKHTSLKCWVPIIGGKIWRKIILLRVIKHVHVPSIFTEQPHTICDAYSILFPLGLQNPNLPDPRSQGRKWKAVLRETHGSIDSEQNIMRIPSHCLKVYPIKWI